MVRSGPNWASTYSITGPSCAGVHDSQSASVTSPDSFTATFGKAASARRSAAHAAMPPVQAAACPPPRFPAAIGGLPAWSSTNRTSGSAVTVSVTSGSWPGEMTRS